MIRPILALLLLVVACDGPAATDAGVPDPPDAGTGTDAATADAGTVTDDWRFETFDARTVAIDDRTVPVELVRAHRPDGGTSYLLYFPAAEPNAPLMVMTEPYAGIDWTGEALDARWATRGAGLQDDDDAPGWDGDDQIVFTPQTIDEAATSSNIFLLQGVAMVRAYGRFYAGGDITDDAMDAAAPYYFARSLGPAIDRARIGAYGGSWGGFMVVYGAALAPDETVPRTAVALAPPSDFADMWRWAATDLPALYPDPDEATRFFSPYLRRIEAAAGGPPATGDYTPFSWRAVCDGLRGPLLVPHDEWDVLVTVRQTEGLIAACPDRVTPLYWHRQAPTDYATVGMSHGPFDGAEGFSMTLSLPLTHLLLELIEGRDVVTVIDDAPLAGFLQTLRDEQLAGGDPVEALPRLRELADPRVLALASDGTTRSGAEVLATGWNSVYGTAFDADGIRAALVAGLPSP